MRRRKGKGSLFQEINEIPLASSSLKHYFCRPFERILSWISHTVIVAQLVRALVCGTRGRRFEPGLSPKTPLSEGFCFFIPARVGTAFDKTEKTKPHSDVYFVQNPSKVSGGEARKYPACPQLFREIRRIPENLRGNPARSGSLVNKSNQHLEKVMET